MGMAIEIKEIDGKLDRHEIMLTQINEQNKTMFKKIENIERMLMDKNGISAMVYKHEGCYREMRGNGREGLRDKILRNALYLKIIGFLASASLVIIGGLLANFI